MKRVGIIGNGFVDWGGGLDFIKLIATSLHAVDSEIELHVLLPVHGPLAMARNLRDWIRSFLGKVSHRPSLAHLKLAFSEINTTPHLIDYGQRSLSRAASQLKLDVLIPAISPQSKTGTPWVGYIYDFQHKYLPHFFSNEECIRRDEDFRKMLDSAQAVIVNAQAVADDIDLYYPTRKAQVFVLPFCPAPSNNAFKVDINDALRRYGIKNPYFIVCNQFWKHKDHGTAFRAFASLYKQYPELLLVCTGSTSDYRFPNYFADLMQQAKNDGVADRIHILGLIPKPDQLALIRGCVALVQPTLFEGGPGGGAVYDAVSLGKRSIISDIPVNKEITEPEVTFFRAGDAESLSEAMKNVFLDNSRQARPQDPSTLIDRGTERRRACGQVLIKAINHVISTAT